MAPRLTGPVPHGNTRLARGASREAQREPGAAIMAYSGAAPATVSGERSASEVTGAKSIRPREDVPIATTREPGDRSEEHTSELQSLMRISYAVFCLNKKKT